MEVKCINNEGTDFLILNKVYEVSVEQYDGYILNSISDRKYFYRKDRFEIVSTNKIYELWV